MNEEEYRAAMVKEARIANLINMRRLCAESSSFSEMVPGREVTRLIRREMGWIK